MSVYTFTDFQFEINKPSHYNVLTFTLSSFPGVSKAILDAAGPAIVDECTKLGNYRNSCWFAC